MSQVIPMIHAHGHNDGARAIVQAIAGETTPLVYGGTPVVYDWMRTETAAEHIAAVDAVYTLEGAFPASAAELCAIAKIPPGIVTSVLLLIDATTIEADPFGAGLRTKIAEHGIAAFGLGNVWRFDPESAGAETRDALAAKTVRLIAYLESYFRIPVRWIATAPETAWELTK